MLIYNKNFEYLIIFHKKIIKTMNNNLLFTVNSKNENLNQNFLSINKIINVTVNIIFSYNNLNYTFIFNTKKHKNSIIINEILTQINKKIPLNNFIISYFNENYKNFILIGKFPLKNQIFLKIKKQFENNFFIKLKLRQIIKNEMINLNEEEENEKEIKRAKERKIGFIIKKVFLWRKNYFCGFFDENGNKIKLSLKESAEKVGINKKTLDDYLIQIRMGKKFNFNFFENQNEKIGILRNFIKNKKKLNN